MNAGAARSASAGPLVVLGSTGSIGRNALAVAAELGIPVHAISAHSSHGLLAEQARIHRPQRVVIGDAGRAAALRSALGDLAVEVCVGDQALRDIAADPAAPMVLTAIVGGAGLPATMAAVEAGKRVCIANKEPLVMAGALITSAARSSGAELLPVDSEHSAIFQCLDGHTTAEVDRLILTGSGGPFRTRSDLSTVHAREALDHPTWSMGPKITIDSASLANKALEVIEARWLFDLPLEQIEVLIHPQSIVHSLVAFRDGSVMAQLGLPDMRVPIQYAMTWPEHRTGPVAAPDLISAGPLTFEPPDRDRFPLLDLGYAAAREGGVAPVVFNAANEVAVQAFLDGRIAFTAIPEVIAQALARAPRVVDPDLDAVLAADAATRDGCELPV
ncbi:MAG: 1-deoxy-D-xylulose-5-phosphate reductoisomerase [Planctomycetota bacterium]